MTRHSTPITILMADDDPEDRILAREAFEECNFPHTLAFVRDGEELTDYLYRRGAYSNPASAPRPGLILLDLNMPRKDGREVLAEIKADPNLRRIPVVIISTSTAEEDILRTYDLGANSYITKPVTYEGLVVLIRTLGDYWLSTVELPPSD